MKKALPTLSRLALGAIFAAFTMAGAQAAEPEVQAFRANYGVILDTLEASLQGNGNTRSLKLLQRSRMTLDATSNADLASLFGDAGVPDISSSVAELRRYAPRALAKSAGLPGAAGIHGACSANPHDADSVYGALVAAQVTSSILAAATFVCTQDILGNNGSAVCIPFAIADDIAQGIFAVREWCAGEASGARTDASFERLDHVHGDLADARATILQDASVKLTAILMNSNANALAINTNVDASRVSIIANDNANTTTIVNNANQNKDAIVGELRALACELARLLNTPEGQRSSSIAACTAQPGFPYSWSGKK